MLLDRPVCNHRGSAQKAVCTLGLVTLALLLGGCATYAPLAPQAVAPGRAVRVHLSPAGAERLADLTGDRNREVVEGTVVRRQEDETLVLSVAPEGARLDMSAGAPRELLPLQLDAIVAVEERRVSMWRTAALVGVTGLVAGYFISEIAGSSGGSGGIDDDPKAIWLPLP